MIIAMNISQPATLSSIDTSSRLTYPSSDSLIPKDVAPPIGSAANGSYLWRSILDTHGKEILKCASHQFLDLATALRLETINARDLVSLLAKAGRLGYRETDVVEDETVDPLTYEADGLSASFASTLPGERTDQGHGESTASPQPPPVESPREPKRRKTDERGSLGENGPSNTKAHPSRPGRAPLEKQGSNNAKRRKGGVRMREQRLRPAMDSGKSGPGPGTKVGIVLQAEASALRASNILKRPHIRRGVLPVSSSDTKQSEGVSAQPVDFVVISDSEPESSEDGKY
jgi:hypothetical protein